MRPLVLIVLAACSGALIVAFLPAGRVLSQQLQDVVVRNFPDVQTVDGSVIVPEPIPHTEFVEFEEIIVPSVDRSETTSLVDLGVIEMGNFSDLVVTLTGEIRGHVAANGVVGVVLLPEQGAITRNFQEEGRLEFPIETVASVRPGNSPNFGAQAEARLGFPNYRLLLYNTTERTGEANVYILLSH